MVERMTSFLGKLVTEDAAVAIEPIAYHEFDAEGVSSVAPRFEIEVTPPNGERWRGAFFGGRDELDVVANSPSPDHLIAVAGGVAYVVPVADPQTYEVVPLRPVRLIETSASAGVAVLVGYTSVLAVGGTGRIEW